jgi:hypothetical protein
MRKITSIILFTLLAATAAMPVEFVTTPWTGYLGVFIPARTNAAWPTNAYDWPAWQFTRAQETNWAAAQAEFEGLHAVVDILPDATTNSFLSSPRTPALSTNSITVAAATNYVVGWVTNYAGSTWSLLSGHAYLEGSIDGTNYSLESTIVTNVPVRLRFVTPEVPAMGTPVVTVITNFIAYSLVRPDLFGRQNHTWGQRVFVQPPTESDEAASKGYVDTLVATVNPYQTDGIFLAGAPLNMDPSWTALAGSNGYVLRYLGDSAFAVSPKGVLSFGYSTGISLSGNTVTVRVWTNGITAIPTAQWSATLDHPKWSLVPNVTNSWPTPTGTNFVLTFPKPATNSCFIRIGFGEDYPSVTAIAGVLAMPSRTITASTNTTWGRGEGLVCVDTNYVYVSVGTNQWKRASLSAW